MINLADIESKQVHWKESLPFFRKKEEEKEKSKAHFFPENFLSLKWKKKTKRNL